MAKVTMHEASDGTLHKTKTIHDKYEVSLRVREKSDAAQYDLAMIVAVDDGANQAIYVEDLTNFVVANADILRKLLNDSLVAKRSRKAAVKESGSIAAATA